MREVKEIMEQAGDYGILVEPNILEQQITMLSLKIADLQEVVDTIAKRPVKISSPKDVASLLFDEIGLPETVKRSVSKEALRFHQHKIIEPIMSFKTTQRTLALINTMKKFMFFGRVKSQWITDNDTSGRIYCRDFNVQQLPLVGRLALVPNPSCAMMLFDYKQNELRVLAALSGSLSLQNVLETTDPHRTIASTMLGKALDEITDEDRERGKIFMYGLLYGMNAEGLARRLNNTPSEAQKLIDQFFSSMPEVLDYIEEEFQLARSTKRIVNPFGHVRRIEDWTDEQKCRRLVVNTMVQGTAASLLKESIRKIDDLDVEILASVHDSILVQYLTSKPWMKDLVLENAQFTWRGVHFPVNFAVGTSWGDCMTTMKLPSGEALEE